MELREYGPVYSSWSSFEEELHDPLEGVAGCVSNCSSALDELTEDMSEDFLPVLREYVLYIESMKVSSSRLSFSLISSPLCELFDLTLRSGKRPFADCFTSFLIYEFLQS